MPSETAELLRRLVEAFNVRPSALAELSAEDLEFVSVLTAVDAGGSVFRGPDLWATYFDHMHETGRPGTSRTCAPSTLAMTGPPRCSRSSARASTVVSRSIRPSESRTSSAGEDLADALLSRLGGGARSSRANQIGDGREFEDPGIESSAEPLFRNARDDLMVAAVCRGLPPTALPRRRYSTRDVAGESGGGAGAVRAREAAGPRRRSRLAGLPWSRRGWVRTSDLSRVRRLGGWLLVGSTRLNRAVCSHLTPGEAACPMSADSRRPTSPRTIRYMATDEEGRRTDLAVEAIAALIIGA